MSATTKDAARAKPPACACSAWILPATVALVWLRSVASCETVGNTSVSTSSRAAVISPSISRPFTSSVISARAVAFAPSAGYVSRRWLILRATSDASRIASRATGLTASSIEANAITRAAR